MTPGIRFSSLSLGCQSVSPTGHPAKQAVNPFWVVGAQAGCSWTPGALRRRGGACSESTVRTPWVPCSLSASTVAPQRSGQKSDAEWAKSCGLEREAEPWRMACVALLVCHPGTGAGQRDLCLRHRAGRLTQAH